MPLYPEGRPQTRLKGAGGVAAASSRLWLAVWSSRTRVFLGNLAHPPPSSFGASANHTFLHAFLPCFLSSSLSPGKIEVVSPRSLTSTEHTHVSWT